MLVSLLVIALQSGAPAPAPANEKDIVVTGKPLATTEADWRACIARNCPPNEEIKAALTHGENQFMAGHYAQARETLHTTIGRVERHAKDYPVAVAGIWRADARIAAHTGQAGGMKSGQIESVDALKAGLPEGDARILAQRLEIGEMHLRRGELDMARNAYGGVVREAKQRGIPLLHGAALLRLATLETTLAQIEPRIFGERARKAVRAVLATDESELQPFRDVARLLSARLEAYDGRMDAIDRIAAEYRIKPTDQPTLLYAPLRDENALRAIFDKTTAADHAYVGQWADLSYLIGPDGRVSEPEILRGSDSLREDWLQPVIKAIAARRYAPVAVPAGLPGIRKVERYTLTSTVGTATGSRMNVRTAPRIEMLDLTTAADAKGG